MRYPIYARGHREPDLHSRIYVPIFTDLDYAKSWLDFFLDGEETTRVFDTIRFDGTPLTLKAQHLDRILDAKGGLELSSLDERRILRFKYGTWDEVHDRQDATVVRAPKVERERRPERPSGFVTIGDLAATWNIQPMHARAALRASGREKPSYGWAFDPKEIEEIKKLCLG